MKDILYRNRQIIFFLLGPILCLLILQCPAPEGLGHKGMKHLAAAAWILVWWLTELFPLGAVSLLSILIYGIVDVMPPVKAYAIFANSNLMLMVGAMMILGAWKDSGLITRYAYWVLSLPWIKGRPRRLMLVFAFATGLVSTIVPNLSVAILFVSLAVAIGKGINAEPGKSNTIRGLCVMSGVGSALGGAGTPIGGAPNLVVIGVIASSLNYNVTFAEWTALGMPVCLLMLLAMVLLAYVFFPSRKDGLISNSSEYIQKKREELGSVTAFEHASMFVMGLAMLLWVFGQPISKMLNWEMGTALFAPASTALLMGCSLLFLPIKRDKYSGTFQFAMSWKSCVNSVDWGMIIFTAGAILFGENLVAGGVDKWLGNILIHAIGDMPPLLVWFVIMLIGAMLSQVIVNLAVVGLFIPVTATLAAHYGLNPVVVCLTVGMLCNVGIMFSVSSVPIAAAMLGSEGYSSPRDYIVYGFSVLIVCSMIALFCGILLGNTIFPMPSV